MWYKYADKVVGIDRFGESAPAGELFKEFGFTVENVVAAVNSVLELTFCCGTACAVPHPFSAM